MYSYARTKSILKKAASQGLQADLTKASLLNEPEVHELLRYMNDLNEAIRLSCELKKPSSLAHHLFDTCKVYNRLLAQISILKADSQDLVSARLALLDGFAKVLKQGLELLGMVPPERM
jgi:arginyl-tRNA synthetase